MYLDLCVNVRVGELKKIFVSSWMKNIFYSMLLFSMSRRLLIIFLFYDKWPTSGEFLASLHEHRIKHLHKKNDPVLFFYKKINLSDKMYKKRRNTYTYICFGLPVWAAPTLYETVYIKGVIQWYMCQKIQILSNKC